MQEGIDLIVSKVISTYLIILNSFSPTIRILIELSLLVMLVFLYSIFIWKIYHVISAKNILKLDLNRYNTSEHPLSEKLLAGLFYFLEYILILPFLIFFWFTAFTLFLILITENLEIQNILIISATIIAVIRMASYYKEDLSKELSKMLPFTLLAIAITNPGFFNFEQVLSHFSKIPSLLNQIPIYLLFIIFLEAIMRFFDFIFSLFGLEEDKE